MRTIRTRMIWAVAIAAVGCTAVVRGADRNLDRPKHVPIDPDGVPIMVLPPEESGSVAAGGDCEPVGAYNSVFARENSYRGNVVRMDFAAKLTEFKMRLAFQGQATLHFTIHELQEDEQGVETFERVFLKTRTLNGTGAPTLYSSLALPGSGMILQQGKQYAIGVAWAASLVGYGRDTAATPRPFSAGELLGFAALNTAPPHQSLGALSIFNTGLYSMELCFEPVPGACCDPILGCIEELGADCDRDGAYFHGQRTTCADVDPACVFGACCDKCGGCKGNHTREACELAGDSWAGGGTVCPNPFTALCPKTTGACCTGASCNPNTCADECTGPGKIYLGDGTDCTPNMCGGACCLAGEGCAHLTRTGCTLVGGTSAFRGEGTTCDGLSGQDECGGACCATVLGTPRCIDVPERLDCTEAVGFTSPVYRGDALTCEDVDCNDGATRGACCMPDGSCLITSEDACDPAAFFPGVLDCESSEVAGCRACCTDNGCKMAKDPAACQSEPGGVFTDFEACIPNRCGIQFGACCLIDEPCIDTATPDECNAVGGRFKLDGLCSICETFSACCRPNGSCQDFVTTSECDTFGGEYFDGESCDSEAVTCPALGACCRGTGACVETLESHCDGPGDAFVGEGTACLAGLCVTGACCGLDELCGELTEVGCAAEDGDYRGDDTVCDETVLCGSSIGACCFEDETCEDLLPQECFDQDGTFLGADIACADHQYTCSPQACCRAGDVCDDDVLPLDCLDLGGEPVIERTCIEGACNSRGACCQEDVCTVEFEDVCGDLSGVFLGNGTDCAGDPCRMGACCDVDGGCVDDVLPSQCSGEHDVWTEDVACEQLEPPCVAAVGACCDRATFACVDEVIRVQCTGEWTIGRSCDELDPPCAALGACCDRASLTCMDDVTATDCEGLEWSEGVLCADLNPPCFPPTGACCIDSNCNTLAEDECTGAGGTYQGDDVSCDPNPCQTLTIVDSNPPHCSVDAGQPSDPAGNTPMGWKSVEITFNGDASGLTMDDFAVSFIPDGTVEPMIDGILPGGDSSSVVVTLDGPIPTRHWTCITYVGDGSRTCIGFLPGNVNEDDRSVPNDILALIDCLNGIVSCDPWQCDIDRSGVCAPQDVLREIDLLNGASAYEVWQGAQIDACPSLPGRPRP